VATSLNQFCRSIGATLGSAVFGSILILRAQPDGLSGALDWVFTAGALVMAGGLIGSLIWREIPLRRAAASEVLTTTSPNAASMERWSPAP
jgi:hypothetical protein